MEVRKLKRLLSQNNLLKILSVALALLLWMFVNTDTDDVTDREITRRYDNVQLTVRNQNPNLTLIEDPEPISVTFKRYKNHVG